MDTVHIEAQRRVLTVFTTEIGQYILCDIERLTNELHPDTQGKGGCAVPLALTLFAVIDWLSYLVKPPVADPLKTSVNLRYLLTTPYFAYDIRTATLLVEVFRKGLTHQFFPKAASIYRGGANRPLLGTRDGKPTLNADILARDVVTAIANIQRDVSDPTQRDLTITINARLDDLAKRDAECLRRAGRIPQTSTTTMSTGSSSSTTPGSATSTTTA